MRWVRFYYNSAYGVPHPALRATFPTGEGYAVAQGRAALPWVHYKLKFESSCAKTPEPFGSSGENLFNGCVIQRHPDILAVIAEGFAEDG